MKKVTKTIAAAIGLFVLAVSAFAAPKKTTDDWVSEIENVTGPINWKFKDSLKNAKVFKGEYFYSVGKLAQNWITIVNPMVEMDNISQFSFIQNTDFILKYISFNNFNLLEKGDVFLTFEGSDRAVTDLWILSKKTVIKDSLKGDLKTGVTVTNSSASSIVMQYRGWGVSVDNSTLKSSAGKNGYQGQTIFLENDQAYYSVSKPVNGTFKVMILNTRAKTVTEYTMQYLGSTNNETAIKAARDKEKALKDAKKAEDKAKTAKVKDLILSHSGTTYNPKSTPEGLKGLYVYPRSGEWYINGLASRNFDKDTIIRELLSDEGMSMFCSIPKKLEWNKDGKLTYVSGTDFEGDATIEYSGKNISVIHAKKSNEENASVVDYKFSYDAKGKCTGVTWTANNNNYETKISYDDAGLYSKTECYKDGTSIQRDGTTSIPVENDQPFDAETAFSKKLKTYDENGYIKTFYIERYKLWFYVEYEFDGNGRPVKGIRHAIDSNGDEVKTADGYPVSYECSLTYNGNSVSEN